jgi:hypothetical protein
MTEPTPQGQVPEALRLAFDSLPMLRTAVSVHEDGRTWIHHSNITMLLNGVEAAVTALTQPAQRPSAVESNTAYAELPDEGTPGPWFVRKLVKDGELRDCFVAAPDYLGSPYDAEILGDDEYRNKPESDETSGMRRKLADCELIVDAVNQYRASHGQAPAGAAVPVAVVTRFHDLGGEIDWTSRTILPVGANLYAQPTPTAQAAPAAGAVAGLDWPELRNMLAMAMLGFGGRQRQTLDAASQVLDTITEPGMPLAILRVAPTPAAQAYSIDADPQGIRARVADAITGALAFGAQGANPPPSEHWLAPFWNAARADRAQQEPPHA